MRDFFKLLRVKHYIKNFLVFLPIFFGSKLYDPQMLLRAALGFMCFCMVSSSVYILNDYNDIDRDRLHPTKKNRPLASGAVNPACALIIMGVCLVLAVIISVALNSVRGSICIVLYLALNIAYSLGLKNKPIADIVILASGFVIRVIYGGLITDTEISKWLYLVVVSGSLYLGLGKRRNELRMMSGRTALNIKKVEADASLDASGVSSKASGTPSDLADTRGVLKYYNVNFLDKNMYVCAALADVFYALWTFELTDHRVIWTVPAFIVIMMWYSLDTEGDSDGDPVEVILHDKGLIAFGLLYAASIFALLYVI